VPAGGAWIDMSSDLTGSVYTAATSPFFGRYAGSGCLNWTTANGTYAAYTVTPDGGTAQATCNTSHVLACCNTAPLTVFAGVTIPTAPMTGSIALHALCNANYPGSHLCHASEYSRASSSAPIPASGAWLDMSSDIEGSALSSASSPLFGRYAG